MKVDAMRRMSVWTDSVSTERSSVNEFRMKEETEEEEDDDE